MNTHPISLQAALDSFDELWSPQIVAQINDYDVRVAKLEGEFVWHSHTDTDELFLVLDGEVHIALRDRAGAERTVQLPQGAIFVVPKGVEHKPSAPTGASILLLEPTGTLNVGDRHDALPEHITATAGKIADTA